MPTPTVTVDLLLQVVGDDRLRSSIGGGVAEKVYINTQRSRTGQKFSSSATGPSAESNAVLGTTSAHDNARNYAQARFRSSSWDTLPSGMTTGIFDNMTYGDFLALPPIIVGDGDLPSLGSLTSAKVNNGAVASFTTNTASTNVPPVIAHGVAIDLSGTGDPVSQAETQAKEMVKGYEAYARQAYRFASFLTRSPLELIP